MREERSGSTRRPLSINDDFFERLEHLAAERFDLSLQEVARLTRVSQARVKAIASGEVAPKPERVINYLDPDDVAAGRRELDENYEVSRVQRELELDSVASFSVTYNTGYSARGDALTELKTFMARESGRPESVRIDCGKSWRGTSFNITLRDGLTTGRFEVRGERREIDYYYNSLDKLLRESEPDHPWLHYRSMSVLTSSVGAMAFYWTLLIAAPRLFPAFFSSLSTGATIAIYIIAPMLIGVPISNYIQKRYERTFPKCQFEYGPEWRRQRSRRELLIFLLTAFAIPIFLTFILPS